MSAYRQSARAFTFTRRGRDWKWRTRVARRWWSTRGWKLPKLHLFNALVWTFNAWSWQWNRACAWQAAVPPAVLYWLLVIRGLLERKKAQ